MKSNFVYAAFAAAALAVSATSAEAAIIFAPGGLNLTPQVHDVNLPFESINYVINGSNATLTATVSNDTGSLDFGANTISGGAINLTVHFALSGSTYLPTDGSIDVSGKVSNVQTDFFNSLTLLKFGYTENATGQQALEFLFGPGTGVFNTTGDVGVILHSGLNTAAGANVVPNNNFNTPFSNSFNVINANSDTFSQSVVPEPASLALLGLSLPLLARRRRKA